MHRTYDPPFTQSPAPNTLLPHLLPGVLPLLCRVPPGTTMSGQMLAPPLPAVQLTAVSQPLRVSSH